MANNKFITPDELKQQNQKIIAIEKMKYNEKFEKYVDKHEYMLENYVLKKYSDIIPNKFGLIVFELSYQDIKKNIYPESNELDYFDDKYLMDYIKSYIENYFGKLGLTVNLVYGIYYIQKYSDISIISIKLFITIALTLIMGILAILVAIYFINMV